MKNCIHFFLRLAMLAMMLAAGFYATAQPRWGNEPDPRHGNPLPFTCDEPCDKVTRRHFQVAFNNPSNQMMIVHRYEFTNMRVSSFYPGLFVSQPHVVSSKFIEWNPDGRLTGGVNQ
ncbi:MAG: hypothetical protein AB8F95_15855 [Bacteroidia bacterium]